MGGNERVTIGIVGAGVMGAGIAQVAAVAGHQVLLFDNRPNAADLALDQNRKELAKRVERGKITQGVADDAFTRMSACKRLEELEQCGLVIEAIIEDYVVKESLLRSLDSIVGTGALIATNTSSLSVTRLGSSFQDPSRFAGLHFFNPAPVMSLVEIVTGLRTAPKTALMLFELAERWGKVPVNVKDAPGFIANRGARSFYSEPLKFVEEGGGDFASVDAAFKANGFRLGPFELIDLVGLDVNLAVSRALWEAHYGEPRYRPSRLVEERVDAGWLGKKIGRGFYDYSGSEQAAANERRSPQPEIESLFEADLAGIVARTVCMLINEGFETVQRSIACREDVDKAMTLGLNFPKGPFEWCKEIGARYVLSVLDGMLKATGDPRYRASFALRHEAENG